MGGLDTYLTVRTLVRLGLAGVVAGALGFAVVALLGPVTGSGKVGALVVVAAVGAVVAGSFVVLARRLRVTEMQEVLTLVTGRFRRA